MPNWTRNALIVASEEKRNELILSHCPYKKETKRNEMDFNTIVSMPKEMDIECGSKTRDGVKLYLARLDPWCSFYGNPQDKIEKHDYVLLEEEMSHHPWLEGIDSLSKKELDRLREENNGNLIPLESLGLQSVNNVRAYGSLNWYEWCMKHWGTKWNASSTRFKPKEIHFDTAWNPPLEAMIELSRIHPKMPMALLYADEQTGAQTGLILLKAGRIEKKKTYLDFSKEAYKIAFRLFDNEEEYYYDKLRHTYLRKEFEETAT